MNLRRWVGMAALMPLLAGCGGGSALEELEKGVEDGQDCPALFDIRNDWDSNSEAIEPANEILREIGCHSSSSTRTDQ